MIIDNIKNADLYRSMSERIAKAFDYIVQTDFSDLPTGRHEIEGDDIFALVLEYETKVEDLCKIEAHYKYIDLQYIISGEEYMGLAQLTNQIPVVKNEEHDYAFYETEVSMMKFVPDMFALYFPNDLHETSIMVNAPAPIRKVVVKIRLEEV